jgi:hypothetical protein
MMNPTLSSAGMGNTSIIMKAISGKASICTPRAVKNALGCRITRKKSENVSERPTPNMTRANTDPTDKSTKKAGLKWICVYFRTNVKRSSLFLVGSVRIVQAFIVFWASKQCGSPRQSSR